MRRRGCADGVGEAGQPRVEIARDVDANHAPAVVAQRLQIARRLCALEDGESSSKDSQIDLSPPPEDAKKHPGDSDVLVDEGSGPNDTSQFQ